MATIDWLNEIKLQRRETVNDFWKDLDLVLFDPTKDGQVHLSYFLENKSLRNETKMVKELLNAKFGLRIVEKG